MGKVKMPFETWEGVMQSQRELEARAEKAEAKLEKVRSALNTPWLDASTSLSMIRDALDSP